jgi:hypothetical protein
MPRFHFDAEDEQSISEDKTGSEFSDEQAALNDARAAARQLSGEQLRFNQSLRRRAIIVKDEAGRVLRRVQVGVLLTSASTHSAGAWPERG